MTPAQEEFYIGEPIRWMFWKAECDHIDRMNAGARDWTPIGGWPIRKLTFDEWKQRALAEAELSPSCTDAVRASILGLPIS